MAVKSTPLVCVCRKDARRFASLKIIELEREPDIVEYLLSGGR